MDPTNMPDLGGMREKLDNMKDERKNLKSQHDIEESALIKDLLENEQRYIQATENGDGPFWSITKDKKDGTFNNERLLKFMEIVFDKIQQNEIEQPFQAVDLSKEYLKEFEQRSFKLNLVKRRPPREVESLKAWSRNEID